MQLNNQNRLVLIHQTDLACAEQIIRTQTMRLGSAGLFEAVKRKAHKKCFINYCSLFRKNQFNKHGRC